MHAPGVSPGVEDFVTIHGREEQLLNDHCILQGGTYPRRIHLEAVAPDCYRCKAFQSINLLSLESLLLANLSYTKIPNVLTDFCP